MRKVDSRDRLAPPVLVFVRLLRKLCSFPWAFARSYVLRSRPLRFQSHLLIIVEGLKGYLKKE